MYESYFKMDSAEKRQIDLRFVSAGEQLIWFKIWRVS